MIPYPAYQMFADFVLILHFAIVVFVIGGLVLIIVGNMCGWYWVNALWFRLALLCFRRNWSFPLDVLAATKRRKTPCPRNAVISIPRKRLAF